MLVVYFVGSVLTFPRKKLKIRVNNCFKKLSQNVNILVELLIFITKIMKINPLY